MLLVDEYVPEKTRTLSLSLSLSLPVLPFVLSLFPAWFIPVLAHCAE